MFDSCGHYGGHLHRDGHEGDSDRSSLGLLREGDLVNLERSMKPDALLDGHIVQGHVSIRRLSARRRRTPTEAGISPSRYEPQGAGLARSRGFGDGQREPHGLRLESSFRVAIIPYTFEHTNFCRIEVGSVVNLEFDIVGKYIARLMQNYMK